MKRSLSLALGVLLMLAFLAHPMGGTAAFQAEAVGVAVGPGLCDGIESEQVESLHRPVGHRGDPKVQVVSRQPNPTQDHRDDRRLALLCQTRGGRSGGPTYPLHHARGVRHAKLTSACE